MQRLLFVIISLIGVLTINNVYGQVSKSAPITNSDFHPGMQLMGGLGFNYSAPGFSNNAYIGLEGSFSLGSFENPINLEFLIKPTLLGAGLSSYEREANEIRFICPFILAPRWNFSRVAKNNFYMYIQPEIGYAIHGGCVYGGRLGLGLCPYGSLYMEALGSTKILQEETELASRFLFFSIGYSFHFW